MKLPFFHYITFGKGKTPSTNFCTARPYGVFHQSTTLSQHQWRCLAFELFWLQTRACRMGLIVSTPPTGEQIAAFESVGRHMFQSPIAA